MNKELGGREKTEDVLAHGGQTWDRTQKATWSLEAESTLDTRTWPLTPHGEFEYHSVSPEILDFLAVSSSASYRTYLGLSFLIRQEQMIISEGWRIK